MKNIIRIVALVGAFVLVLALGVTAFANSNSNAPSVAPATPTTSPSDDPRSRTTNQFADSACRGLTSYSVLFSFLRSALLNVTRMTRSP